MPASPPPPSQRSAIRLQARIAAIACALVAALLIAGCGGSHAPHVASLPSSGHGSSSHSSASNSLSSSQGIPDPDGRPRETLDDTMAQINKLNAPFAHCDPSTGGSYKTFLHRATKCIRFILLPPWQYDPQNPQSRAFIGSVVSCLQAEHYHVKAYLYQPSKPFGASWDVVYTSNNGLFGFGTGFAKQAKARDACQQKAQQ